MTDPTPEEFSQFTHLAQHLVSQKGGRHPAGLLLFDCWFFDAGEVPEWAATLAEHNAPGWTWCPRITPRLLDLHGAEAEAWCSKVLTRAMAPN